MNIVSILRVAIRALMRNKVRSLLTTLGIIMGIASVIAMMAVGEGATAMIKESIKSFGDNLLVIFPGSSRSRGMHGGAGTQRTLTADDGAAIYAQCPYVVAYSPVIRHGAQIVYQQNNWGTRIQGVNTSYPQVRNWEVGDGDFFSDSDERSAMRVAVLGATVAENLFGDEDPVGKSIRINNMNFRVIGLMQKKGTSGFGMDQDDTVLVPLTTARRVLANTGFDDIDQVLVTLASMDYADQARADITAILRERHRLAPGADDDFNITDMTEVTDTISSVSVIMTILLTVIASISLLVGGIGIMNIMLVSVTERTREIGLRMAVGARSRDILLQFLVESMTLAAIGGVLGVGLGALAARVLSSVAKWPVSISASYVVIAIAFAAAVGVFFGFYPAWRAARLNPIDALRYE